MVVAIVTYWKNKCT